MASKELEIIIRAKDNATPAMKKVSDTAKEAGGGFSKLGDTLKKLRAEDPGETLKAFGEYAKTAAVVVAVTSAMNMHITTIKAYKEALLSTGSAEHARQKSMEEFISAIPIVGKTFKDIALNILGAQSADEMAAATDEYVKQAKQARELAVALSALGIAERASRPGRSDASRFMATNLMQRDAALEASFQRRNDLLREQEKLEAGIKTAEQSNLTVYGGQIFNSAELVQMREKLKLIKDQVELLGEVDEKQKKIFANQRAEYQERETSRKEDTRITAELRYQQMVGDIRRKALTDFGATLAAEVDMIRSTEAQKIAIIFQTARKEMKGKDDEEKADIVARARREAAAVKQAADLDANTARTLNAQAKLNESREKGLAADEHHYEIGKSLNDMLIDGLTRQGQLGDANAGLEAERLRIVGETVEKRRELVALIASENVNLSDRAAAVAALMLLPQQEAIKKAMLGNTTFVGQAAGASNGYFTSGQVEATMEKQIINPIIEQQKKANDSLKGIITGIEGLPTALKSLGQVFLIGSITTP